MRSFIRGMTIDLLSNFVKVAPGIHILNGHYIAATDENPEVFLMLLERLRQVARLINIDDATKRIADLEIPTRETLIAFTFDDGFEECFTKIKPILDVYNIKAGFFINPGFVDGDLKYRERFIKEVVFMKYDKPPMTWSQIKCLLNEGHIIGSHTMDHTRLNISNEQILHTQIVESKRALEQKLNYNCEYFAFPYGRLEDISTSAIAIARQYHRFCFTQTNYTRYFSLSNQFINRRHFEGNWKFNHVKYFLRKKVLPAL